MTDQHDAWSAGQSYEHYMGRWSRLIAAQFVGWLSPPRQADWLEIDCGTGALTATVLNQADPASVHATDLSDDFVTHAAKTVTDRRVRFSQGDAQALPQEDRTVDIVTSGLVLNFVPDKPKALAEMHRVLRPGGQVAFYVWDYPGGGMGFIDAFWRAAARCDPKAAALDEASRFPFCTPKGLRGICAGAGLTGIKIGKLDTTTSFPDFEAFWHPFTLGAGPAPGYCRNLPPEGQQTPKRALAEEVGADGPVSRPARAWAERAIAG